jgi:hypothetical protein
METKFQTSFIPKKPMTPAGVPAGRPRVHGTSSIFMTLSTLVFIISLLGAGGAYARKYILTSSQVKYKDDLATLEKGFNIDQINQLKQINVKIDLAKKLLANHLAASQIFDDISQVTIESVRFSSLDITTPNFQAGRNGDLAISLNGYSTSFSALAFESDVLGHLEQYGLRNVIKNPIVSNPTLNQNGTVSFGLTATVDANSLSYENSVTGSTNATGASATTTPVSPGNQ